MFESRQISNYKDRRTIYMCIRYKKYLCTMFSRCWFVVFQLIVFGFFLLYTSWVSFVFLVWCRKIHFLQVHISRREKQTSVKRSVENVKRYYSILLVPVKSHFLHHEHQGSPKSCCFKHLNPDRLCNILR